MGIIEKIKEIEEEMARTQKNKATEYHLGLLKAKIARYRAQLLEPTSKSGPAGVGFDVQKSGDARVALIGFPSVGKSTLLSKVTHTQSEAAAYEFTTLTAIPGVIEYKGARIQLLDLPGIVEGASQGRGRGRQVVSTAKTADLILIMLDATKSDEQRRLLEHELDAVGIRLNKNKPDVVFKRKTTGGITFNTTVKLTRTDEKTIRTILAGYKLHNCDIMIREDITTDEFIDVLIGTRKYLPCLYVYNKIDAISLEQVDKIARQPHSLVISCEMDLNLDYLIDRMWDELRLVKIYTKKRGVHPDLSDPVCLRKGATIEVPVFHIMLMSTSTQKRTSPHSICDFGSPSAHTTLQTPLAYSNPPKSVSQKSLTPIQDVCNGIHRSLAPNLRYGLVWGKSSKFNPHAQKVSLHHQVADEDVVSIFTK
ncbi:developmentally regulated GTP-binding protein [Crepidotus variabilis]|uniref:Developmentally regulated GTP-binding protein n=1 Tax=Crepidotus variabilis TaxID=179855 RepID=A0A9P6JK94_9AGAR|nr:developmentally regulated GTP-binding protein [Crepidotus variabilis]